MAQIGLILHVFIFSRVPGELEGGGVSGWERPGMMKWGYLWTRGEQAIPNLEIGTLGIAG